MSKLLRGRNRAKIGSVDDFENQEDWLNNGEWIKPDEWLDISNVANNEIHILATDGYVGFSCTLSSSGTYSIDWGDGTVETLRASTIVYHHQYNATNGGYMPNLDMWQYKIRIYDVSTTITKFLINSSTPNIYNSGQVQYNSILWFYTKINTFTDLSSAFIRCVLLQSVTIPYCASCSTMLNLFNNCKQLVSYKSPILWNNTISNINSMFSGCKMIHTIKLPMTLGSSINDAASFLNGCSSLKNINNTTFINGIASIAGIFQNSDVFSKIITVNNTSATQSNNMFAGTSITKAIITNWGNANINKSFMFNNCTMLKEVTLPINKSNGVSNTISTIFAVCVNLTTINNISSLGHNAVDTNADSAFTNAFSLTGILTIDFRLSKFSCEGINSTYKMKITGLRLTHPSSGFGGTSPQINCSYCDFSAAALNTLFGDLPTLTGKTINITGCTGAATCDRTIATAKGWTVTG